MMSNERDELLQTLAERRWFLRSTTSDLTDDEARRRTTVSELCLGGLIKHVASTEATWAAFIAGGADAMGAEAASHGDRDANFAMSPNDTLAAILDHYEEVASRTDELLSGLDDLDISHRLPDVPWFPPETRWSARRVILHLIGETAQHAGHADILREAIDGKKTMG